MRRFVVLSAVVLSAAVVSPVVSPVVSAVVSAVAMAADPGTALAQGSGSACDSRSQNTYGLGGPGLANGLTVQPGAPVSTGASGCSGSTV